jgi:hypothetical protein
MLNLNKVSSVKQSRLWNSAKAIELLMKLKAIEITSIEKERINVIQYWKDKENDLQPYHTFQ